MRTTFSVGTGSGLWRVPAVGGEPEQLTTPVAEQGELNHYWPEILPGVHPGIVPRRELT